MPDKPRSDNLEIWLVDDCSPETIGVFSTERAALSFATDADADRIRVGELDSREWARTMWTFNRFAGDAGEWEKET